LVKDQVLILARTVQIRKEKQQSIITLRHEGQSIRKISGKTFNVSVSSVAKNYQALP
jgi:azurin